MSEVRPDDLPELQDKGIIQVALGDYHYAALTASGEMWTWGQGNNGALGLGLAPGRIKTTTVPQRVVFPGDGDEEEGGEKGEKQFIFAITAAGWHTGALVLGGRKKHRDPSATVQRTSSDNWKSKVPGSITMMRVAGCPGHSP